MDATQLVLIGHRNSVTAAAFSPDGQRIFLVSDGFTVRAWDPGGEIRTAAQLAPLIRCRALVRFARADSPTIVPVLPDPAECQSDAQPGR